MHAVLPRLVNTDFPPIRRGRLETLQVNLGYRCNQACLHCHVNAGPTRKEEMDAKTCSVVLDFLQASAIKHLDLTGGAPELNPNFRSLVRRARALGVEVIDRCNLTILLEPGQEDLAGFLAQHAVVVTASLPCYIQENVDRQRGEGVFYKSLQAIKHLNALGYGRADSSLTLNLVYNPQGPSLPPPQEKLEVSYKKELWERHGIAFNNLLTITNMPIQRFGSTLISKGQFNGYMDLLRQSYRPDNLDRVMCRSLISVDWGGYVYDCDFNQMLGIPLTRPGRGRVHLSSLIGADLSGNPVAVADHCYGCAAGEGSSCSGALATG